MTHNPDRKKSGKRRKQATGQPEAKNQQPQAQQSSRRATRKEAARTQAKKKRQLQMLVGGIVAVVLIVGVVIFINRPTSSGVEIDYSDITVAQSEIVVSQGTATVAPGNGEVAFATGPAVGDPNAPVTMHIYSDFQCHFCKVFNDETLPQIIDDFVRTGQVKLVFHDFPRLGTNAGIADPNDFSVELHDENNESSLAAQAAMCAGEQDQYLQMSERMFGNYGGIQSGAFSRANLDRFANDMSLDTDAFGACMDSQRYVPALSGSVEQGMGLGITGTPMFILDNGSGDLNVIQQTELGYDMIKRQIELSIQTAP